MKVSTKVRGKELLNILPTNPTSFVGLLSPAMLDPEYAHNFPFWRASLVPTIKRDPQIRFGLNLIKGPIQTFTVFLPEEEAENPMLHETIREQGIQFAYGVRCKDEEIQKFVIKSYNRLWQTGLQELLLAVDWGFSCCQVMFRQEKGEEGKNRKIVYDSLQHINPFHVIPLLDRDTRQRLLGVRIRGVEGYPGGRTLKIPKIIWHVHAREHNRFLGQSRLEWAFVPWHEKWTLYGARDIRRTWFFRNAYDGGTMRYPPGKQNINGQIVDNLDYAAKLMGNMRTGGYRILPSAQGQEKNPQWDFEPPSANPTPEGLMEYPEALDLEELKAMGIPPEVVESSGDSGFGASTGRKVPLIAYYASLSPLVNNVITDFDNFVLRYLVKLNFKKEVEYEIYKVVPLKGQPDGPDAKAPNRADAVEKLDSGKEGPV